MKVLLLGKNGQVGHELERTLAPLGELVALGRRGKGGLNGDLTQLDALARMVRKVAPDVIVNAAAYTAVEKAETEKDLADLVNTAAPGVIAREAASRGAWLIHYSTDYVFDGSGSKPWRETDPPAPLSVYGHSKLRGEAAIRASGCRHLILRTSWVYGAHGSNFAKTMIKLAQERDVLRVVADQVGAPTGAELLAGVTAKLIPAVKPEHSGTYHLTAAGETSWHGYARHVIARARRAGVKLRVTDEAILPVTTKEFHVEAERPLNSRLDTHKIRATFGLSLPPWQEGVDRMLAQVLAA